ncbi:toll/interleukin-1 receptor domain-containing protein [Methylocystis hirsuta]|uniref:Toll/interleukin-1 receptor domain-containing protein n=1 Tax=Methylocystis hirsuta TaxID=369798 RepID=A0A3M9XPM9_9HYPH|nr:toll/interleukin-1 receptor domain-containing protein [Methylocystis hirsuta]RNJ50267.1 toll/interleukin-1 receptor domain-containing protein [Methylocystis hirsuta]
MAYRIFISHGWHDRWIARQMARLVADAGGSPFIDIFDIEIGDRIAERVLEGTRECRELVALLTPWSVERNWVWAEIAAVWALGKRFVGVTYGVTIEEIEKNHGGMAFLGATNLVALDDFDGYISQLAQRIRLESE